MKKSKYIVYGTLALLLMVLSATACGNAGNSNAQPQPTNPDVPRTAAPTRASATGAIPTQDPLDDSTDNLPDDDSTAGPRPTQDVLDDSGDAGNLPEVPETRNGQVVLPGTAWIEPAADRLYRFCENSTWELVQGGATAAQKGTFTVNGAALALTNSADQKVTEYQMQWIADARTLKLAQGGATLTLEYEGAADCGE